MEIDLKIIALIKSHAHSGGIYFAATLPSSKFSLIETI